MQPRFDTLDADSGLEIIDPIESRRFVLHTSGRISPTPADTAEFAYPVATACEIVTESITLPYTVSAVVRDASDGSLVVNVGHIDDHRLDANDYLVELNTPIKLYFRVDTALEVVVNTDRIRFEFDGQARVRVGARSLHTSPAGTVTVPDDPEGAMAAVSSFGSALETTSPERSWPTLRGHPPRVERGDELAIPDHLAPPETGVTLHVPPEYDAVFAVAPLAYYLGATVVPGDPPRLTTEGGLVHRLDTDRGFEEEVIRLLKRVVLLDCVTRTEGYYPIDLRERQILEDRSDVLLDFEALYDAPLGEQLEAYLSVPFSALADAMPMWGRVVYARPVPEVVESLPFAVNDLSLVRIRNGERTASASPNRRSASDALADFKRGPRPDRPVGIPDSGEYVPLPEDDAIVQAWLGEGTPVHGVKLLPAAFDRDDSTPSDGVIDVTVVCNDERMREEWDAVSAAYGTRDIVPFDVDCRFAVSTADLRDLLARETDLFHFIGHIDGRGFDCPDGVLDAETVAETGTTVALLNGCRSHDQGVALVEAGARATVVSTSDVGNLGASEVGETFAQLLNYGFNVGSALDLAESYTAIGRHYVAIGDSNATVAQCVDGYPVVHELAWDAETPPAPDDEVDVTVVGYTADNHEPGSAVEPYFASGSEPTFYLPPGPVGTFTVSGATVRQLLADYSVPIIAGGKLRWGNAWLDDRTAETDSGEK